MERLQSLLNYNRYQFLSSDPTHFKTMFQFFSFFFWYIHHQPFVALITFTDCSSGEPFGTFLKTKTRGRCRKK